jgi:hypothetical protein
MTQKKFVAPVVLGESKEGGIFEKFDFKEANKGFPDTIHKRNAYANHFVQQLR